MIENNLTTNGKKLSECAFSSREIVIRICDACGDKSKTTVNTILRCRKKHNRIEDYCLSCACTIYNSGNNNPSKRKDIREKISAATKGKSKIFKDGKNLRKLDRKINTGGYVLRWSDKHNKHVLEHQLIMANSMNKKLQDLKTIHHIDNDKKNNRIDNLIELSNSEHSALHKQIEGLAFKLLKKNIIYFDKINKKYIINPTINFKTAEISYGFNSVALTQQKNILNSRLDANIKSEIIRGITVEIPMIAANMSTVINADFYKKLHRLGAFAILHRAKPNHEIISDILDVKQECEWVAASIGIDSSQLDLAKNMISAGCNVIVIDIAHGFSDPVLELAKNIKLYSPDTKIVVGNTTNADMLYECYKFVDAIKVGIAQGFACETKNTAGCTEKQLSAILKFKHHAKQLCIPVISDGSISEPADLVKAIAAGSNSIMAGKIFASCPESAADIEIINNKQQKVYAGMASRYVQEKWKGSLKSGTCPEGGIRYLDIGESAEKLLERYSGALRSGITYCGAKNIKTLQENAEFIILNNI